MQEAITATENPPDIPKLCWTGHLGPSLLAVPYPRYSGMVAPPSPILGMAEVARPQSDVTRTSPSSTRRKLVTACPQQAAGSAAIKKTMSQVNFQIAG